MNDGRERHALEIQSWSAQILLCSPLSGDVVRHTSPSRYLTVRDYSMDNDARRAGPIPATIPPCPYQSP
jgi:hypothetical protein